MNRFLIRIIYIFVICQLAVSYAVSQVPADKLKQFLTGPEFSGAQWMHPKELNRFYEQTGYKTAWLGNTQAELVMEAFIKTAGRLGLEPPEKHTGIFGTSNPTYTLENIDDSIKRDIAFTDVAINYLTQLLVGSVPQLSFNGLDHKPACFDIPILLAKYVTSGKLSLLQVELESREPGYLAVKSKFQHLYDMATLKGFQDKLVTAGDVKSASPVFRLRLQQLGFTWPDSTKNQPNSIKNLVKVIQEFFGLPAGGAVTRQTINALNTPLSNLLQSLGTTLHTLRWLTCIRQSSPVVIVNIPSASLLFYENGKPLLESRIIAGKITTRTPTLSSKITEVIAYPYWHVPYKIAVNEILPAVKRNRGYLAAHNYQVLYSNGKVADPAAINWQSLSSNNFPYILRQSTGCDNSLGLVKLNFYNPFSVYLHDTPGKLLFNSNKRFYSHGCMRVQKAMELARLILKDNSIAIDSLDEKGCIRNQSPIEIKTSFAIPVFVLYHTAWINADGRLSFYEDIYSRMYQTKR